MTSTVSPIWRTCSQGRLYQKPPAGLVHSLWDPKGSHRLWRKNIKLLKGESPALQLSRLKSLAGFSSRKDALPSLITFTLSDTKGMRDQLHANLNKLIGFTTEQGKTKILHNIMFINLNRKHEWTNF